MQAIRAIRGFNGLVAAASIAAGIVVMTAAIAARGEGGVAGSTAGSPEPPQRLSDTGLYLQGTLTVDPRNRPYSPQYPLWSDGAAKSRWVQVPAGTAIDIGNIDAWDFPIGTKFWKEFAFNGHKVETRFLWKATAGAWVFATYIWNDEQTGATLAPEEGVRAAAEIAAGVSHSLPSVEDCRACHDSARTEILGFNALQLSTDRDPNAPHAEPLEAGMVTLRTLIDEGLATPARRDLVAQPPRIRATDPVARAAQGYLSANCGHCHNAEGLLAPLGLFLKQTVEPREGGENTIASAIGRASLWQIPTAPEEATRVIEPGLPELSAVFHRMKSRRPASQMPPLGTKIVDHEAVQLIERWIRSMNRTAIATHAR